MTRIVEYETDLPAVARAINGADGATGRHETWYVDDDAIAWLFWVSGDVEGFEGGLPDDPSIASFERIAETPDERLYRVRIDDTDGVTVPDGVEHLSARFDREGATGRAWCASAAAVDGLREVVTDACGWFEVTGVYEYTCENEGRTVHVDDAENVTEAVVAAIVGEVADSEGVDENDLPPLYDVIDPELLALIVREGGDTADHVSFTYYDHRIVVRADGSITVA